MSDRERRKGQNAHSDALRAQLNEDQQMTLSELERFGCELRFVRRPLFQEAIPVLVDGDRKGFSILKPDGTVEDDPTITLRA
ncbi:hypothetical protein J2X04_000834 [Lysobacter niabensis]|uniref:Uncharacterized protein n=1 Tax=Agrilutibacter niabensis TaxID=380628 RepID=A0ABU1VLX9_9GAMM|nr:hypothetical protein [Lysobacter niabensis]MDR7098487.1 hypothetical protein [Lysobacter niabensis]